jgi:hypothetical protein
VIRPRLGLIIVIHAHFKRPNRDRGACGAPL